MKYKVLLSTIAASLLMFSGCENVTEDTTQEQTVNGVVADGYIQGANVILDFNCNGVKDGDDLSVFTDANGKYTFNTEANITGACIIAQGGFDTERQVLIQSAFIAPASNNVNVTPLTTIAYSYAVDNNLSYEEATNELSTQLGIPAEEFTADPEQTLAIKSITTQIQSAIDLIKEANSSIDAKELYKTIAYNIKNSTDINISQIVTQNMPISDNLKQAILVNVETVNEMLENQDFSNYAIANHTLIEFIENNQIINLDTFNSYLDSILNEFTQNITSAKLSIDGLGVNLIELNATSYIQTATVTDAKNMFSEIRDIIYEIMDPNIEDQETNTTTLIGNIIDNVNNSLDPSVTQINSALENVSNNIDNSLTQFDEESANDFNTTFDVIGDRLDAIGEVLSQYEENESFSDVNTTYGDTISHTYDYDTDTNIVTDTYTINAQTLTVSYPEDTPDFSQIEVNTTGVINLNDDNYSLNITSLMFKDNKLLVTTNGKILGNDDALITGNINIGIDVDLNQSSFDEGAFISSLNNLNISINGDIKTSTNKELQGTFTLTDNKLELAGIYKDITNNVELDGNVSINASNTLWKTYLDDKENMLDEWDVWDTTLVTINNKLVTKFTVNWNTNDVNLTTFDGDLYECNVTDFYPDLEGLQCQNDPDIQKVSTPDLAGKLVSFTVNDKTFIIDNIWNEWNDIDENISDVTLSIDSPTDYYVGYNDDVLVLESGDETEEVNNISYNISEPINTEELLGDIKFQGKVINGNTQAYLSLAMAKTSTTTMDYYIDSLSLTSDNLAITAPNLLKVSVVENNESNDISEVNLNDFNATVTDTNGNEAKLVDVTYSGTFGDTNLSTFYGQISYMDTTFTGYANIIATQNNVNGSVYANINKIGYEPITITATGTGEENNSNISLLLQKGDYEIGGYYSYNEIDDSNNSMYIDKIQLFDNNGVLFHLEHTYYEDTEDDETLISITNKDGETLADINTSINTWEIKYSDGDTETLY